MTEQEEIRKETKKHEAKLEKIRNEYGKQAKRRLKKLSDALQLSKQLNALDKKEFDEFIQILNSNSDISRQINSIVDNVINHNQIQTSAGNSDLNLPLE